MFTLPKLPYAYDALEPAISGRIMELHHKNHHQTYVDKLNKALESEPKLQARSLEDLLRGLNRDVPESARKAVRNHGGGHYNHSLFWEIMTPNGQSRPEGKLLEGLEHAYGSFDAFVKEFSSKATALFGSGWVWLMPDLSIISSPNQDNPISDGKPVPILGLDVWEHAYYLDYTYKRADYIKAWWSVINWDEVSSRYTA